MDKTYERINSLFEHGLIDSGISILISVVIVLVINLSSCSWVSITRSCK